MIHKNCFVDKEGNYIWIDQEWCFNDIPASYVLFHNIVELYSSNSWLNSYITIKQIFKHYNLNNKTTCYFNVKKAIFNTIQNQYSTFNYWQLSDFDYKNVENNIVMLHNNLINNQNNISETEKAINNILNNGTIDELVSYVNTLTDDIILKDIPDIPKFIVKYFNANENEQMQLSLAVKCYKDISTVL